MLRLIIGTVVLWGFLSCSNGEKGDNDTSKQPDTISVSENADDSTEIELNDPPEPETDSGTTIGPDGEPINDHPLIGNWRWEKTICCGRMKETINDSTGGQRILKFKAGGTVEYWLGKKLEKKENFVIGQGNAYPQREDLKIGIGYHALIEINGDQLILNYEYMDLQIEYYRRMK